MLKIEDGRLSFYQWDLNQRLVIDNPSIIEVHYTNALTSPALVCEVYEEYGIMYANVPNILLQTDWTIKAYGCCDDYVIEAETFIVNTREKPADYVYTETEIKRWDALEKKLTDGIGYYKPTVSADGNLSWTANNPAFPAVDTVNIKGIKGDKGDAFTYEDFTEEQLAALKGEAGIVDYSIVSNMIEPTNRKLDALWKLNEGISYQFETDNNEAYQKQVIRGAKLADIQSVGGKTVVWNQLCDYSLLPDNIGGLEVIKTEDKVIIPAITLSTTSYYTYTASSKFTIGHKVYICGCPTGGSQATYQFYLQDNHNIRDEGNGAIVSITSENLQPTIRYAEGEFTEQIFKPRIIDLTMLFGGGNEPTTTDDSRIAWIKQYATAHPEYNTGELVSADVESVKYNDAIIADIPASIRTLPGYGWSAGSVYNSIERTESGWKYIQRVGSVDLGSLTWKKHSAGSIFYTDIPDMKLWNAVIAIGYTYSAESNALSIGDKRIWNRDYYFTPNNLLIRDDDYTNIKEYLNGITGKYIHYVLKEPIITDITEDMLEPFEVKSGGIITYENAAKLSIPNSVEYLVSLAEVNS